MADRTVYGHTHSENGWRMVDQGSCVWVKVPGTNVTLQIREGQPAKIMGAFAADYNAHVEPLRDADSACWTATNSVATSNHLSGTGMDLNWNGPDGRTFRLGIPAERAFPGRQWAAVQELLAFYEGLIFNGGAWSIRDFMHWQMGANTYGSQHFAKVEDFIRRKIRADGFSTFKRGGSSPPPPPPPPKVDAADVLARATGVSIGKAREILPGIINGLRDSQCTNVNRVAMWLAQMGHESAGFNATEEYASGSAYEGRRDLGNTQPGDGVRFKGRSWIQITGRHNYTQLSKWAHSKGAVPTPTFFVDEPAKLAQIQFAGLGPAWYWTVARSDINALSDRRDLVTVTKRINGGTNGLQDRQNRYNRALALGDQLLTLTTSSTPSIPGDDMALVPQEQWDRVYRELTQRFPSRSPLRHLGEGLVDTLAGFTLNVDGSQHVEIVRLLAGYGHPGSLALLREVASADPAQYPDRQDDAKLAQAILAEVTAPKEDTPQRVVEPTPAPQMVYLPTPEPVQGESTGAIIGRAYDALEALQLSGALSDAEKAPLAALIGVLQTKTEGAQQ